MGALLRSSEFSVKNLDGVIDNHGIAALFDPERTFFRKAQQLIPFENPIDLDMAQNNCSYK